MAAMPDAYVHAVTACLNVDVAGQLPNIDNSTVFNDLLLDFKTRSRRWDRRRDPLDVGSRHHLELAVMDGCCPTTPHRLVQDLHLIARQPEGMTT